MEDEFGGLLSDPSLDAAEGHATSPIVVVVRRTPALEDVVVCAGGLRVAQRHAESPLSPVRGLHVGLVAPVSIPYSVPVTSQRSDGAIWRRHWSEVDRLVIDFVDLAVVEVTEPSGLVTFNRVLPPEMEQHLLFDHVLPLVLARRGFLVLHGGVISRAGNGAVLVGATGAGKSTITAFAWQQGWTVGGDDGAVVHATEPPTVEPTYTTVRLTPGSAAMLGIDPTMSAAVIGKMRIAGEGGQAFSQKVVQLRVIAIIERADAGEEARFEYLDAIDAHARLFGSTFHADLSKDRLLPAVLDRLARVVETSVVGRLIVPRGREGLSAAERLLRAALEGPAKPRHARGDGR